MIGTDSHTPNAGGLGMMAIGVGGADAVEVMAGSSWETRYPEIVGVKLSGRLGGWASAKDVIFELLKRLTVKGGTGKIFEYFGEGARALSATQKATITNMGAELGATSSVFVYDTSMDAYLRNVGRKGDADWARSMGPILSQDEICLTEPRKVYHESMEIDLSTIEPAHAGPFSPDKITAVKNFGALVTARNWPERVSSVLLGSCTNSSYSDLCGAAEVLEQAAKHGLKVKVPFMVLPGSQQVYETIKRDGILDRFTLSGAVVFAPSCGPCIGQWDRKDIPKGTPNCLFTTFNRNFRARNDANPETRAFLTSPALAAALAVSGKAGFDPARDALIGTDGIPFKLEPPSPPPLPEQGMAGVKEAFVPPGRGGKETQIRIDPDSDRLQLLEPFKEWDGADYIDLPILVKTQGKTTTDQISPGGEWLRFRGHLPNISQNLLSGALNAFTGETGRGVNVLTGKRGIPFSELAEFYKERSGGFVIIGDENYGEGSSREHAAMSPRFLGARVVVARSIARIHETNLKKQGILPLVFVDPGDYDKIETYDRISFVGLSGLEPGKTVRAIVKTKNGASWQVKLDHTFTDKQVAWFRAGSALNAIRKNP
jgi:aconitate hydratase